MKILIWVITAILLIVASLRVVAHDAHMILVWANMATLYIYLPAYLISFWALLKCKKWLMVCSVALVAMHIAWVAPDYLAGATERDDNLGRNSHEINILSANLLYVNLTQKRIDEMRNADSGVIFLQEYSSEWDKALRDSYCSTADCIYPKFKFDIRDDAFGQAIFSKNMHDQIMVEDLMGVPLMHLVKTVEDTKIHIFNVHTLPPRTMEYTDAWNIQNQTLLERVTSIEEPVVLAGDFNMTQYSFWYKKFIDAGFKDCFRETGQGFATTFPNGVFTLPSLRMDHVFVSNRLVCEGVELGQGFGSDHRPVQVTFEINENNLKKHGRHR